MNVRNPPFFFSGVPSPSFSFSFSLSLSFSFSFSLSFFFVLSLCLSLASPSFSLLLSLSFSPLVLLVSLGDTSANTEVVNSCGSCLRSGFSFINAFNLSNPPFLPIELDWDAVGTGEEAGEGTWERMKAPAGADAARGSLLWTWGTGEAMPSMGEAKEGDGKGEEYVKVSPRSRAVPSLSLSFSFSFSLSLSSSLSSVISELLLKNPPNNFFFLFFSVNPSSSRLLPNSTRLSLSNGEDRGESRGDSSSGELSGELRDA